MSIAVLQIISDLSDPSLSRKLHMFNVRILAKYATKKIKITGRCDGGLLLEQVKTTTLRLLQNPLLPPVKITPLYSALCSHTLMPKTDAVFNINGAYSETTRNVSPT